MKWRVIIFIAGFIAMTFLVTAQGNGLQFNLVEGPDGKSFGHIRTICQDQQGYMWFAAQYGKCVYRYDGSRFIIFRHNEANPNSLGGNSINSVSTDNTGKIWIGMDNGLDQYDPLTGNFKHFLHKQNDSFSIAGGTNYAPVIKDRQGRIWVGTNNGLDRLDEKTGKFFHYRHDPKDSKSLSCNIVWNVYEDHDGVIWVATGFPWGGKNPEDGGLNRLNADGSFTRYKHDPADPHSLINNKVATMFEDSRGVFWVGTGGDGLHIMDRKTGKFERLVYDPKNPDKLSRPPLKPNEENDKINFITEDCTGAIWIGTEYSGLNRYDTGTKKITHFQQSNGFPASSGWYAFTSKDGEFWITTEEDKLYRVDPFLKKIPSVSTESIATHFMEDEEGNLWVTTTGNGLIKLDQQLHPVKEYKNIPGDTSSLFDNFVISIFQHTKNSWWVGTGSGIRIFDKVSQKFSRFAGNELLNDISGSGFPCILRDRQGYIWLSRWGQGLICYHPKDHSYKQFLHDPEDSTSIGGNMILSVIEDRSGIIWTGGINGGGISRFNRETGKFNQYLRGKSMSTIFQDTNGYLWADGDDGLFRYTPKEDKFYSIYETQAAISTFKMNGIVQDNAKDLWINSESALIKLNPDTKETFIYGHRFGINPESLALGGIYLNRKGQILAGHKTGFYIFYPDELKSHTDFHINISGLFVNSMPIVQMNSKKHQLVEDISELNLSHDQNNVNIEFAAIDYRMPEAIRYIFMMEGYDREWQELKAKDDRSSRYLNLRPGTYVYRVKAFNDEGATAEKMLTVVIHPPWWKTWWAYSLYGLMTLVLIVGLYRIQRQRIIQKERQKQQAFELAQAKEIEKAYHELRSTQAQLIQSEKMASLGELTAGIAHEIQNPLNFVNNFSDVNTELIDEAGRSMDEGNQDEARNLLNTIRENEEKIRQHGQRADAIVKSMLQHSRTSSGQKEPTNINALADEYFRLAYHGLRAKDKSFNANMKTDFDDSIEKINIVPQDIGRVLLNIYNNAFYAVREREKHEAEGYEPAVHLSTKKQGNKIFITVRDNGNGIPKNVLNKIFQPFFTTKPTGQGTGLGLSMSYDIIKAHGGTIKVESMLAGEIGGEAVGAVFTIALPVENPAQA